MPLENISFCYYHVFLSMLYVIIVKQDFQLLVFFMVTFLLQNYQIHAYFREIN